MQFSKWVISLVFVVFLYLGFSNISDKTKPDIIHWDGYGYFVYLPKVFIYPDDSTYSFATKHGTIYPNSYLGYQLKTTDGTDNRPIYNIGMAIIWAPLFLIAHLLTLSFSTLPADGMSALYQWSVFITASLFLLLGLVYLKKWMSLYIKDKTIGVVLLLVLFATNFYYYFLFGKELTHIYLFSLLATFAYYCDSAIRHTNKKAFYISSLLLALAVLVRSSEILWIIIPALLHFRETIKSKQLFAFRVKQLSIMLCMCLVGYFLFQITFDYLTTGRWLVDGYSEHRFDFMHPNVYEQSIGPSRGWLTYTPLLVLMFWGFSIYKFKKSIWPISIGIFILCYFYLISSWDDWTFGSTFGNRPMLQTFSLLCLPLGITIEKFLSGRRYIRVLLLISTGYFILQNLVQSYQYQKSILPRYPINYNFYRKVYMKTELDNHDKMLIDLPEAFDYKTTSYLRKEAILSDFSVAPHSKSTNEFHNILNRELKTQKSINNFPHQVLLEMAISYFGDSYNYYTAPRFVVQISDKNKKNKLWKSIALPEVMNGKKDTLLCSMNLLQPNTQDVLQMYITNNTEDSMHIDFIQISHSSKEYLSQKNTHGITEQKNRE